jgi:hypothetical protein
VVVIDFNNREVVSPYNILVPQGDDLDYFLTRRLETLKELLPSRDKLSLRGAVLLKQVLALLSELRLPITYVEKMLSDAPLRARLVRRVRNPETKWYFQKIFSTELQATIGAVRSRVSELFASESIKLSLGGASSPDFRRLQDEGKIVLVNCAGPRITRGVRLLLLAHEETDEAATLELSPRDRRADDGIGSEREPSDRSDAVLEEDGIEELCDEERSLGMEAGAPDVRVVAALGSRGEREVAESDRPLEQNRAQAHA